ncbi:MAG: nitrous oxide reductase accessory protein NosL [Ignavibacteria bacterium]|nr:nitrous oxide reductase accessory protein NosL [Ignavibacteria bacterium]
MPRILCLICSVAISGCGLTEVAPVDIYPEDNCSHCRMAISDSRFAAEIITADREVFKFDDIGCMEQYRSRIPGGQHFVFVRDYEDNRWLPLEKSTIVRTGIMTPMGSGKLAFGNPSKADAFLLEHPLRTTAGEEEENGRKK